MFLVTPEGVAIGDPLSIDTIDGSRSSGTVIIATSSLSASGTASTPLGTDSAELRSHTQGSGPGS